MSNSIALLCEDHRHEQFIRIFLRKKNRLVRRVFPDGYKSHEKGGVKPNNDKILKDVAREVRHARKSPPKRALVIVIDGDSRGLASRQRAINLALKEDQIDNLNSGDRVAVVVPCRNIETWVHHFAGNMANEVDDYEKLYPKRGYEADTEAKAFAELVSDGNSPPVLNLPALEAARLELRRLLELMKPE